MSKEISIKLDLMKIHIGLLLYQRHSIDDHTTHMSCTSQHLNGLSNVIIKFFAIDLHNIWSKENTTMIIDSAKKDISIVFLRTIREKPKERNC